MPSCQTRRRLAPTRWRPSGRKAAARSLLPTSPLPDQFPEAKREEAASQRGRAHNFAASGRARAGVQGSSCPRPELGEFISSPLCGGAGGCFPGVQEAVAEEPAAARAASLARAPGCAALRRGRGRRRCRADSSPRPPQPRRARRSAVRCRAGRGWGRRAPRPPARRAPLAPPAPVRLQAPRRIWRLLLRPPGDRRGEDTCFARDPSRGLSGVGSAAAAPESALSGAVPSPQRPPPGVLWAEPPPRREARAPFSGRRSPGALAPAKGTPR